MSRKKCAADLHPRSVSIIGASRTITSNAFCIPACVVITADACTEVPARLVRYGRHYRRIDP